MALQEKERIASEEAEKRLKAALTAKREPNTTASRVASPAPLAEGSGTSESTNEPKSASQTKDVAMESVEEKAPAQPEALSPGDAVSPFLNQQTMLVVSLSLAVLLLSSKSESCTNLLNSN